MQANKQPRQILTSLVLYVALIVLLLAGWTDSAATQTKELPLRKEVIKIGWAGPLKVEAGRHNLDGVRMAMEDINAAGGVLGSKFEVIAVDSEQTAVGAISAIEKLVTFDKVDVLVGGCPSEESLALQAETVKFQIIGLAFGGSPKITEVYKSDPKRYKYYFNFEPDIVEVTNIIVPCNNSIIDAIKKLGVKKVRWAVWSDKLLWTEQLHPITIKGINGHPDAEVVWEGKVGVTATDFTTELTQIAKEKAHAIFLTSAVPAGVALAKQWRDLNVPALLLGMNIHAESPTSWRRALGDGIAYTGVVGGYCFAPVNKRTAYLLETFAKKYGYWPSYSGGTGWNALNTYAKAIKAAKTIDADAVSSEIERMVIPEEEAWGGPLCFDNHRIVFGIEKHGMIGYALQYDKDGAIQVIYPSERATSGILVRPEWLEKWRAWEQK
jgi:branched-chain amino acid transport system substrate-binding protein